MHSTLDWVGTALCLGFSTCLLLGLEWGGSVKPWKSASVIAPLCVAGVLVIVFVVWEGFRGSEALVPYSIFYRRTQTGASLEAVGDYFRSSLEFKLTLRFSSGC